jgi:hypothetical protein
MLIAFFLLGLGCSSPGEQPAQQTPEQAVPDPVPTQEGQPSPQPKNVPTKDATSLIPWQILSTALPTNMPDWKLDGTIDGKKTTMMGIPVSQASCKLKKESMTARVQIVDTLMNPVLIKPFNAARSTPVNSSKERLTSTRFENFPAMQKYDKKRGEAEITILVHDRILVSVEVGKTDSEALAFSVVRHVNLKMLEKLAGG